MNILLIAAHDRYKNWKSKNYWDILLEYSKKSKNKVWIHFTDRRINMQQIKNMQLDLIVFMDVDRLRFGNKFGFLFNLGIPVTAGSMDLFRLRDIIKCQNYKKVDSIFLFYKSYNLLRSYQEMLGLPVPGVRVTIRMPDQFGEFNKLMSIIGEHKLSVMGVGTYPSPRKDGYYDAVFKISETTLSEVEKNQALAVWRSSVARRPCGSIDHGDVSRVGRGQGPAVGGRPARRGWRRDGGRGRRRADARLRQARTPQAGGASADHLHGDGERALDLVRRGGVGEDG